jgi:hypothetical protein
LSCHLDHAFGHPSITSPIVETNRGENHHIKRRCGCFGDCC